MNGKWKRWILQSLFLWFWPWLNLCLFPSLQLTLKRNKKSWSIWLKIKLPLSQNLSMIFCLCWYQNSLKTQWLKVKILIENFILIFLENFKFNEKHDVAILFCDISNFDEIIGKEQENVVQILDKLYRCFDDLCFSFGVQKIEVIHYNIFDDMFFFFFLVIHVLNFSNIK